MAIAALAPFGTIFPLYFQKAVFLEAALGEMNEEYVAGLDKYGNLPMCILVLILSIILANVSERISRRRVQRLCSEERIPGVTKIGSYWAVPADAIKPKDERVRSGKHIKKQYD